MMGIGEQVVGLPRPSLSPFFPFPHQIKASGIPLEFGRLQRTHQMAICYTLVLVQLPPAVCLRLLVGPHNPAIMPTNTASCLNGLSSGLPSIIV
jgi:hypothetical protein